MIMFIRQKIIDIKWKKSNKLTLKIELIIFTTTLSISNIKNFDARLLKIDKKSYKDIDIYDIGYITKKKIDDCENIYSVNPLYLFIDHASGCVEEKDLNPLYLNINQASGYIKEKGVNKYLVFDSTDENKKLLKKYNDAWNGIKNKFKE